MKLLRVKILGKNFRSLPANVDYVFNDTDYENKLSTKVFAGLNGSGKSNFLELIAEIFYYLERYSLENTTLEYRQSKNIGFEIEYVLPKTSLIKMFQYISLKDNTLQDNIHIKIRKPLNELPEFSYTFYGNTTFTRLDENQKYLLPSNIIAYTSGQNELLSNPFIRLKYYYFTEIQDKPIDLYFRRMYFIDQESNNSIFIANMLLGKQVPLNYIKKIFSVVDLHSFRITINYNRSTKVAQKLLAQKLPLVEPLKACATSWIDHQESECLILDYVINEATHQAFDFHYNQSAFDLFQTFYELQSLNILIEKPQTRKFVESASKDLNISDELSKPDPSELVFRIEKIKIKKESKNKNEIEIIDYKSLSDGEHQLNEVIGSVMMMEEEGSLFLMDEPDTHFNPKWRAKMVTMLNKVSGNAYDQEGNPENIRKHEIIMTTHSPFIISDNYKEDVYKFSRKDNKLKIENPKHETYGTSITFLMKQIFERDITISDFANKELLTFKKELKAISDENLKKEKIDEIEERLVDFGESVEKFDLYNYLSNIKKK